MKKFKLLISYFIWHIKWLMPISMFLFSQQIFNSTQKIATLIILNTFPFSCEFVGIIRCILIAISVAIFVESLCFACTPVYKRHIFKRDFLAYSIKNSKGEVPKLLSIKPVKYGSHHVVYKFNNNGVSAEWLNDNKDKLSGAMKTKILSVTYSKNMKKINILTIKSRYDTPKIISVDDDYLCQKSNLLVVGATGFGKSGALLSVLGAYAKKHPYADYTICDYKKSTFALFNGAVNFYGYSDVPDGIRAVYKEFSKRLELNDKKRNEQFHICVIDEWGAMITAQDKKVADELKSMVGEILFMGRSLGIRLLVGIQRADSEFFKSGSRDQFIQTLALGNLSKEQKSMLFNDYKDVMTEINGVGEGYLLVDGKTLERVKIANIDDFDKLCLKIRGSIFH